MFRHESVVDEGQSPLQGQQVPSPLGRTLQQILDDLGRVAAGRMDLRESLTIVAELAVRAIPGAEGAGLTMRVDGEADHTVSTSGLVRAVDALQYSLREGPGISAATEGRTVQSPALRVDSRWPVFGAQAAEIGVHSALSLPLIVPENVIGTMNIYARPVLAFTTSSVHIGQLFAAPAAIAVQNAAVLARAQVFANNLHEALVRRSVVDQAVGLLMSLHEISADHALEQLRVISANNHRTIHDSAEEIVTSAVERVTTNLANNL